MYFIYNPVAGNGVSKAAFSEAVRLLGEMGVAYQSVTSEYPGHARELTERAMAEGHTFIIAVGGDGTVREVAEVLNGSSCVMGILPCGTGNDLARALHMPKDIPAALEILLHGEVRNMDSGLCNGKPFFNVAGFGFDVDVLVYTERYKTRYRGLTAYVLGLFRALTHLRLRKVRVKTPEEEITCNALIVEAGNGTHIGGGMNVTPQASLFDGLFDVCILQDVTKLTVLWALIRFVKGKHLDMRITRYFRATEISVDSDPESPLQLDGEIMDSTPVVFKIVPGSLKIMCPRPV